jgi:hypothetical protein
MQKKKTKGIMYLKISTNIIIATCATTGHMLFVECLIIPTKKAKMTSILIFEFATFFQKINGILIKTWSQSVLCLNICTVKPCK